MAVRDVEDFPDSGYGESSQYAAHLDRGWALLDRGDLPAARTSVQHAQEIRPEDPDACVLQGAIALAEGNPEESLRCYDRAIELDPEYLEPYAAAAQVCLFDLDDAVKALRYATDALELEELLPFDRLDLQLIAAECELHLDDLNGARQRLRSLEELGVLETALEMAASEDDPAQFAEDPDLDKVHAAHFLAIDPDGDVLEDDERVDRVGRLIQFVLRLARLELDADTGELGPAPIGAIGSTGSAGLERLRRLTTQFPNDADAWALLGEAEHRHGDPRRSADAGLRTLELDGEIDLPSWVPSPAIVQRRVLQILQSVSEAQLSALARRDPPLAIVVADQPPPELVLEGVDPRVAVLTLASKVPGRDESQPPALTGLSVYRKTMLRFARDEQGFERELRFALLEELAAFFGLDDERRHRLGLGTGPALETSPPPPEPAPAPTDDKPERRRKRRARSLN